MSVGVSSKILTDIGNVLTVNILPSQRMAKINEEDLADFVRRVRAEKGLTTRQVAIRSGEGIDRSYVSQIENRHSINVTPNKLKALAKGLGVPVEEVFSKVRGNKSATDEAEFQLSLYYMLYEKAKRASPEKRLFIRKVLRMIDRELDEDLEASN